MCLLFFLLVSVSYSISREEFRRDVSGDYVVWFLASAYLRYWKDEGVRSSRPNRKCQRENLHKRDILFFFCCRCGFGHGRGGGRRPHSESTSGSGRQRCVCHMRRSRDRKALRRRVLRRLQGLLPAIRQKKSSVHVQVHMSFPRRDKYIIQNILLSH